MPSPASKHLNAATNIDMYLPFLPFLHDTKPFIEWMLATSILPEPQSLPDLS